MDADGRGASDGRPQLSHVLADSGVSGRANDAR